VEGTPWLCDHCGDVIGVYEPMVVLEGVSERHTSRANEPRRNPRASIYHRECRDLGYDSPHGSEP